MLLECPSDLFRQRQVGAIARVLSAAEREVRHQHSARDLASPSFITCPVMCRTSLDTLVARYTSFSRIAS